MENPESFFCTSDMSFSAFLNMRGIDIRELRVVDEEVDKIGFVFRIDCNSEEIRKLQREWAYSQEAKLCKRFAYYLKKMKKEINYFKNEETR